MEENKCDYVGCSKYGRAKNGFGKYCEEHVRFVMGYYAKGKDKIMMPVDYKFKEESWIQAAIDRSAYPKRENNFPRYPKRERR